MAFIAAIYRAYCTEVIVPKSAVKSGAVSLTFFGLGERDDLAPFALGGSAGAPMAQGRLRLPDERETFPFGDAVRSLFV